jgi:hypothetical protein
MRAPAQVHLPNPEIPLDSVRIQESRRIMYSAFAPGGTGGIMPNLETDIYTLNLSGGGHHYQYARENALQRPRYIGLIIAFGWLLSFTAASLAPAGWPHIRALRIIEECFLIALAIALAYVQRKRKKLSQP